MSEPDNPWGSPPEPQPPAGPSGAVPPPGGVSGSLPPYQAQPPYQVPPQYPAAPPYPQQHPVPPGYGYGHYPQPTPRGTNGLAIASLVLGITWVCYVGSLLALIFGLVARKQIRERGESGKGMATAGIVLGSIGIAVFVVTFVIGFADGFSNFDG